MPSPRSTTCSRRPKPRRRSSLLAVLLRPLGYPMRVEGHSMLPLLHPGALIMVDERAYARRAPRRGEVVAARPTALQGAAVVKRIAACLPAGQYWLQGDNAADSLDGSAIGGVGRDELIGPVRLQVWPLKRVS